MPRGQKKSTRPAWAREESERLILETLEDYPEGLRFADIERLVHGQISTQTLSIRLKHFVDIGMVHYNNDLKRYSITEQGSNDRRRLNIFKAMMRADIVEQWAFGDRLVKDSGYPSFFVSYVGKKGTYAFGNRILRKKCLLFRESWLYYGTG